MVDVILDAGHGGRDSGSVSILGLSEKDCTLYIAKKCEEILNTYDITVKQTREEDVFISLSDRSKTANDEKAKYFISIHINSANISSANGTEVFVLGKGGEGEQLATTILNNIVKNTGLSNRGTKFANFAVLRETEMPAILIELCFLSNPSEEELLTSNSFKDKLALSIAKGYLQYVGKNYNEITENKLFNKIISTETVVKDKAKQFAKNKNSTQTFINLVDLYWELSKNHANVNPLIAYAQAIMESNYGNFDNNIDDNFNNPCKLKIKSAIDDTKESYVKFNTWKDGVMAHLDHLALYAGADGYPRDETSDTRHFSYLYGKAKYVEDLSGIWSMDLNYSDKLIKIIDDIKDTQVIDSFNEEVIENKSLLYNIKQGINEINKDLDELKRKCDDLGKKINNLEGEMSNKNVDNNEIYNQNKDLNDRITKYEEIIEDILNLVNKDLT